MRTTENYQFHKFRTAVVTGNATINTQGQGDNPVCSTRDEMLQSSRPFSPLLVAVECWTGGISFETLKQRILPVHHDCHWLLFATKLLRVKLHSPCVKESESGVGNVWKVWNFWNVVVGVGVGHFISGSATLVLYCETLPWLFICKFFQSRFKVGQLKSCGVFTGLFHVKTIALFWKKHEIYVVGNSRSDNSLTFPKLLENTHCTWSKNLIICVNKIWHGLHHRLGAGSWRKVPGCGIAFAHIS